MNEVSPDLAAKVVSADLRNLIKKVGDGGTLTATERQMFIDFTAHGDPEGLHQARINALLKKWLNGARLTKEERDEIAHILPDRPQPEQPACQGTREELAARIGLSRRPFFRWLDYGREHNDPLPAHDRSKVPAWYKRMQERGVFRNKIPRAVLEACTKDTAPPAAGKTPAAAGAGAPPPKSTNGVASGAMRHFLSDGGDLDLNADIDQMHRTLTAFRRHSAQQYELGQDDEGTRLMDHAVDLLDKVTNNKRRALEIESLEDSAYPKADLANDLAPIIRSVVANFLQEGRAFHTACKSALSREAFLELWRGMVTRVTRELVASKFGPPLSLDEAA